MLNTKAKLGSFLKGIRANMAIKKLKTPKSFRVSYKKPKISAKIGRFPKIKTPKAKTPKLKIRTPKFPQKITI